jgi:5'-methylthioadenosine phosphorylase
MRAAVIGGTGFYSPGLLDEERDLTVATPYGEVALKEGSYHGKELVFLARHGVDHAFPPHLVNYRANIWALKALGVQTVLATAATGSLNKDMRPGEVVLVDQFLDFTKSRPQTFYEGGEAGVLHVDMTEPYCPEVRRHLITVAQQLQQRVHPKGTYVCTEGPRYETPAEIQMYRQLGGDVVGMTSVPEVVLAREAGLCYATLALVTNYAAGISKNPLSHREVLEEMARSQEVLRKLIFSALVTLPEERNCACARAAAELGSLGQKFMQQGD